MAAALVPILVGLTAIQVGGAIAQGSATRRLAEMNAETERKNAGFARQAGAETGRLTRLAGREASGATKVGFAAGGIDVNSGTALDVRRSNEIQYELDALKAEYSGEIAAQGRERAAQIQRYQGRLAQRFGYFGAGFAAASGAARISASFERGRADTGTGGYAQNVLTGSNAPPMNPMQGQWVNPTLYGGGWQAGGFNPSGR